MSDFAAAEAEAKRVTRAATREGNDQQRSRGVALWTALALALAAAIWAAFFRR